ncbi:MAG: LON peptidase substrate-binding domain-containing protein [Alphaproteobacteria bacterium]|nr:LON peptidase substrate-binding domain-containing protein [Alphaproteobacteria bacterium]
MQELPRTLPVLKVRSTILMPQAHLPVIMQREAFKAVAPEVLEDNIVAVVQPKPMLINGYRNRQTAQPYKIGCAGKITGVYTTENNITINIYGLCRFEIVEQLVQDVTGIDRIVVNYNKYLADLDEKKGEQINYDKGRLLHALDAYFKHLAIFPNWKEIEKTPADVLVSALAMACPFHPSEKQSLLEAVDFQARSDMITKMIEVNSHDRYNTASTVN